MGAGHCSDVSQRIRLKDPCGRLSRAYLTLRLRGLGGSCRIAYQIVDAPLEPRFDALCPGGHTTTLAPYHSEWQSARDAHCTPRRPNASKIASIWD
jgi:hypothetical protein